MSQYAGMPSERLVQIRLPITDPGFGPDRNTPAHFILSPRTARGLPTSGLALTLCAPSTGAAVAAGLGFTVTIWRAIPVLGSWAALQDFPGANFGDQLTLPDLSGGMALYFAIGSVSGAGDVILAIAEMD